MSPTPTATARRAALTAAMAGALASATLAVALQAPAKAGDMSGAGSVVLAYSDEALPGEGRPPLPGPTDPDGPAY